MERIGRIEQARRVEDDHLHVVLRPNGDYSVARGLRLRTDDAELLANDAVQERRLPRVRLASDGDDTRSCHRPKIT